MTIALPPDEAHIWYALAEDPPWHEVEPAYLALLSDDERARYHRFMFDKDRRQFLLARALVRTTLSRYASTAPDAWVFDTTPHGKPFIKDLPGVSDLQFNHSHADALVACAITRRHQLGVDVESITRNVNLAVARHCLSPRELTEFQDMAPEDRPTYLLRQWTLKEAYSKALGLGLSLRFEDVSFAIDSAGNPQLIDHVSSATDARQWQFRQWLLDGQHFLAVAVECRSEEPRRFLLRHASVG